MSAMKPKLVHDNTRPPASFTGGGDPPMEARIARLEATVDHIQADIVDLKADVRELRGDMRGLRGEQQTDFRILFGALIAVALGLAGIMAKGFGWL